MIPISNMFLISEINLFRSSLAGRFGRKTDQINRIVRPSPIPEQKIENSQESFNRLVPRPNPDKLGYKSNRIYKHPANLP